MASNFLPYNGFGPIGSKLLIWQECHHYMFCSLEVWEYFIAQTFFSRTSILGVIGRRSLKKGSFGHFLLSFFFNFCELGGSNQKMLVTNLDEREKMGKLVVKVCQSNK